MAMTPEAPTRNRDRHASDGPVLFYAERPLITSAAMQGLPLLFLLSFLLSFPGMMPIVLPASLGLVLWQHWAFRFELTATHLWFRDGVLDPTIRIQLETIHEVEAVDFQGEPLIWNQLTALGSLRLSLPDGSSITVAGIREPREVLSAVRLLREFDRATGDCMAYRH
jgi:hypothetical protein